MISLTAITPKRVMSPDYVKANALKELNNYADALVRLMATYPPATPWKNPPRTGLRAGGKRTGNYGRNWIKEPGQDGVVNVVNKISYAVYVGGPNNKSPGQARVMKRRGWRSITDTASDEVKKHSPAINKAIVGIWK